ncbi:MAG: substrate-binding domain-containing protein, partial [Pseudomonadota bacterium]|nr:substrate-binding domain-containing protein [Pseudomonadota bacterium]
RHKLIGFAQRNHGLMVAPGNPLNIRSLHDLTRPALRFVHRPRGTGTRVVLEELLAAQRLDPQRIQGFDRTEPSHQAAAVVVASGHADAAFGIEVAALDNGLDFVPLARENYFLVALAAQLDHPHVNALLHALRAPEWKTIIEAIPGYTAHGSGEVLSLRAVLPWWTYRKPKA